MDVESDVFSWKKGNKVHIVCVKPDLISGGGWDQEEWACGCQEVL